MKLLSNMMLLELHATEQILLKKIKSKKKDLTITKASTKHEK